MIRIFLLVILLLGLAQAAPLTDIRITSKSDQVVMNLAFGAPFEGKVIEKPEGRQLYLLLEGASAPVPKVYTPDSPLIESIRTHPTPEGLMIHISPTKALQMRAERFNDGRRLQLTLEGNSGAARSVTLGDKLGVSRPDFSENYLYMGLFMAALILLWILIKLFGGSKNGSWLTGKSRPQLPEILWQKPIDAKNRVIQLRFKGMNYLILIGQSSNLLIDQYEEGKQPGSNAFDDLLKSNTARLSDYLGNSNDKVRF